MAEENLSNDWLAAIKQLADLGNGHGLVVGLAARLLFDTQTETGEDINTRMSLALSAGTDPQMAACWLEGFLNNSGMILLHDDKLWQLVNAWLVSLNEEYFLKILPLLRRTFSTFAAPERRQLGERSNQNRVVIAELNVELNHARAEKVLPLIRQLLGLTK